MVKNSDMRNVKMFEWVDGILLRSLERGDWVVLHNSNLCNPSVLDRLNPLLEPGGELLVNENGIMNGQPRIVRPHPNFRIFLTMDPSYGEVFKGNEESMCGNCASAPNASSCTPPFRGH